MQRLHGLYGRNYFSGAKHVSVPGRMFPVKEVYLEEILVGLNYNSPAMLKMKRSGAPVISAAASKETLEAITQGLVGQLIYQHEF